MNTPIADFVRGYEKKNMTRMHMPGHKGNIFCGCESMDITEILGADSLYEADGIIAESEANATTLFGTGKTFYSTEGSSQCIRAMLYLAMLNAKKNKKMKVLATRNVHKAFVYAVALLDLEVEWVLPEGNMHSLCSCSISAREVEAYLSNMNEMPVAVYVTSPDYLGGELDIKGIADVCHKYGTILAVDNAHGAYLHFLHPCRHPMDLGADICCDSAHKTLPVLTGGAYLHISKHAPEGFVQNAKQAMALFGSTSPSYLTLTSLDLCNQYLGNGYEEKLEETILRMEKLREEIKDAGWQLLYTDPLKLTMRTPEGVTGIELAEKLRRSNVECEYADPEYVVCMMTPENAELDFEKLKNALKKNKAKYKEQKGFKNINCVKKMSIREAIFAKHEVVTVTEALGCICGSPTVSCPPAIPVVISGELIDEEAIQILKHYGMQTIEVVKE